ncbi:hypothetical protein PFICI_14990 [Pestalotiopsis fici W106-1]|uniref:Peptidase S8/S53 domain-containing protein n=1 Tax=Pestalotiopsis fici (strain W106-1 / CGMCC3.15140) TaxID=1229662 RepID=W3WHI2_PESFW|nr:uncharacterized protein PFICI_14990 [Pestalotiopsis fici W106-1]ETS73385.1 hypothetical protein PFICI_14990 [Pestalotiopsis fici W106-1]
MGRQQPSIRIDQAGTELNASGAYDGKIDDDFPRDDAEIREVFECVLDDLKSDEDFNQSFFTHVRYQEEFYTFSNGKSLNPGFAFDATSKERNIVHHFIERFSASPQKPETVERVKTFIGMSLSFQPGLIGDGLDNGSSPLNKAASEEGCLGIIEAICQHCMEKSRPQRFNEIQEDTAFNSASFTADTLLEEGGHDKTSRVAWSELVRTNQDTFLHSAIKKKKNRNAHYFLDYLEQNGVAKLYLEHYGRDGLTPLHLAVDFTHCYDDQVKLVERLINLCPEALKIRSASYRQPQPAWNGGKNPQFGSNITSWDRTPPTDLKDNLSPFRYFLDTRERQENSADILARSYRRTARPKSGGTFEHGQAMEELLRLSCMRYYGNDRPTITALLPLSLGQIHFDLSPRTEVSGEFLNHISRSSVMRFEPYLQYVHIPDLRVVNVRMEKLESEPWWKSRSRKDYVYLFEWLKTSMKVQKILEVVVDDHPNDFHSDEIIEYCLKRFDVEALNWAKMDMCSDTIYEAAKNVRDLILYWSGNRAILKSWAAPDGLAQLREFIESHDRTDKMKKDFEQTFDLSWKMWRDQDNYSRNRPKIDWQPSYSQSHVSKRLSESEREEKGRKEKWLKCMENFSRILRNALNNRLANNNKLTSEETIKVAIIDDGLDIEKDDIWRNVALGETFYDNKGHWPGFYQSAYGHGTLMANEIRQICPRVELYIAKLNEVWSDGKPQITAKSAAQAIDWARKNKVDIISMSWSIESPDEVDLLKNAVESAIKDNILLFCASDDQGNTGGKAVYPAQAASENIFRIGSATVLGLPDEAVQSSVDFIAPGSEFVKRAAHQEDKGFADPRSGSSIATARCAGLAAVILQCIMLSQKKWNKSQVRTHKNMAAMLEQLVDDKDTHKYLKVWKVFDKAVDRAEFGPDFEWEVICDVASIFQGRADWLPQSNAQVNNRDGARR